MRSTVGGTTGKPRITLHGIAEWEWNALGASRTLYMHGVRPGDVVQIPATCSLANLGWAMSKASQEYLGALALTTGSGVVTPSRRQIEIALNSPQRVHDSACQGHALSVHSRLIRKMRRITR